MNMTKLSDKAADIFPTVATNMRYLREFFGWNRSQLANQLGWTTTRLIGFELGITEPKIAELLQFARFFGAIPEDIIEDKRMVYQRNPYLSTHNVMNKSDQPTNLSQMITQTENVQKMLDGFRAFHELQMEKQTAEEAAQWSDGFQESLNLMEEYLALNQRIIKSSR